MAASHLLRRASSSIRLLSRHFLHRSLPLSPLLHRSLPCSHPPSPWRHLLRHLGTSSPVDLALLQILKDEIEHEKEIGPLQDLRSPPESFSVVDKPGMEEVILYRTFGEEDIRVGCMYHDQSYPPPDDEEADEPPRHDVPTKMVQMTVKISKGGDKPFMELVCVTFGDEPIIERICLKDPTAPLKDIPYEGPLFSDLDGNVKSGFSKYLAARGIDGHLGSYLLDYMCHKEQREYSLWLQRVEGFISK